MRSLLENRNVLILAIAETVTGVGSWVTMMAIFSILIFEGGGGVRETSAVMFAGLAPLLIASPIAGALVDRVDRRSVMIGSQWLLGVVIAALIVTLTVTETQSGTGIGSRWPIFALLALASAVGSVMTPARQAVVPMLVGRDELTRANALLAQLSSATKIGAPLAAGALLAVVPARQAMVIDVISFMIAGILLTRLPALPTPRARKEGMERTASAGGATEVGDLVGIATGAGGVAIPAGDDHSVNDSSQPRISVLRILARIPQLVLFFVMLFVATAVIIGFDLVVTIFTRDLLGGGETLFGLLVATVGFGAFLSSGALLWRGGARDPWRDILTGLLLMVGLTASIPIVDAIGAGNVAIAIALLGALMGGIGSGLLSVQAATLMQSLSPAEALGRVAGLLQSTIVGAQLSSMLLLPLVLPGRLSVSEYGVLASIAIILLVVISAIVLRGLRGGSDDQGVIVAGAGGGADGGPLAAEGEDVAGVGRGADDGPLAAEVGP